MQHEEDGPYIGQFRLRYAVVTNICYYGATVSSESSCVEVLAPRTPDRNLIWK